jgi:hypothetical protein
MSKGQIDINLEGIAKFQKMLAFITEISEKNIIEDDERNNVKGWLFEIENEMVKSHHTSNEFEQLILENDLLKEKFENLKTEHSDLIDEMTPIMLKKFLKKRFE